MTTFTSTPSNKEANNIKQLKKKKNWTSFYFYKSAFLFSFFLIKRKRAFEMSAIQKESFFVTGCLILFGGDTLLKIYLRRSNLERKYFRGSEERWTLLPSLSLPFELPNAPDFPRTREGGRATRRKQRRGWSGWEFHWITERVNLWVRGGVSWRRRSRDKLSAWIIIASSLHHLALLFLWKNTAPMTSPENIISGFINCNF